MQIGCLCIRHGALQGKPCITVSAGRGPAPSTACLLAQHNVSLACNVHLSGKCRGRGCARCRPAAVMQVDHATTRAQRAAGASQPLVPSARLCNGCSQAHRCRVAQKSCFLPGADRRGEILGQEAGRACATRHMRRRGSWLRCWDSECHAEPGAMRSGRAVGCESAAPHRQGPDAALSALRRCTMQHIRLTRRLPHLHRRAALLQHAHAGHPSGFHGNRS